MSGARVGRAGAQLVWMGETRSMVPTIEFLMDLEGRGCSLMGVSEDLRAKRPPLGSMAVLASTALTRAGWRVTPQQALDRLAEPEGMEEVIGVVLALLDAVFGRGDASAGKPVPPGSPAPAPARAATRKRKG